MKKLYRKPWQWSRVLQKVGFATLGLFGALMTVNGQVSSYTFAQSTGTFSSIATTGALVTGSDATTATTNDTSGWAVTIPFTFSFNGAPYTSVYVNSNGGATFGATTSSASTIISTGTAYSGAVGVMSRDLWGVFITSGVTTSGSNVITNVVAMRGIAIGKELNAVNGIPTGATVTAFDETAGTITMSAPATASSTAAVVRYGTGRILTSVSGTAPNRVFVIEWIGYNDYATTATGSNYLNFQLRLAETTNTVSNAYGPQYNISTTARTNEIGLRGASNTDFNNRSGSATTAWTATTAGTTNSASVSRDNTIFPAAGLTFTWSPPTCIAPSAIVASNVTTTTASLSWTASSTGAANGYEYYYSTTNTAPTSTTVPSGTSATTSASISSLTPASVYYVWVRSVCSATDKSGWSSSSTFTTLCNPVTTLSENFDSYATGSIVPNCWFRMTGTGSQTITSTTPASGTRNIYQYASTGQTPVIVVLPVFSNISTGTNRLKLKARVSSGAPGTLDVGYVTDINNAASFVVIQSLTINNTVYTVADADYSVTIPSTVPSTARLAIRNPVDSKSYYWDDVVYEALPTCLEVTSPTVTAVQTSTATLSWTAPSPAPANGYEYYLSTSSTAPTAATVATGTSTTTSAPLTALTPSTIYYAYVRSACSATNKSPWTAAVIFTTACTPITTFPWNENFDAMTTIGNGILPNCWSTSGGLSASNLFTTQNAASQTYNDPRSAPNYVTIYYPTTAAYLWAPVMTLTAGQSYDFTFYWAGDATSGWVGDVLVNNAQSATGATNLNNFVVQTTTTTNAYTKVTVSYVPTTTGTYSFGIRMFSATSAPYYMGFDDFNVQLTPACSEPSSLTVTNITTNSATVSWALQTPTPIAYEYYLSTTNVAPTSTTTPTGSNTPNGTGLTSLLPGTTYYFWVRSSCSGGVKSSWAAAAPFTTLFTPPANDNCSGAIPLTVGSAFTNNALTGTTQGATLTTDTTALTACQTIRYADTWYTVIVPTTGNITIETQSVAGSPVTDTVLGVYSGACGALVVKGCDDDSSDDGLFSKLSLTGQTPGSTLYIGVWNYSATNNGQFKISAYTAASLATGETAVSSKGVSVYPNPFSDVLNISDIKNVKTISIVDIAGRVVRTVDKPSATLQLSELSSGMYIVVMNMNDGTKQSVKVIKK